MDNKSPKPDKKKLNTEYLEQDFGIQWFIDVTDEISPDRCETVSGLVMLLRQNVHFAKDRGGQLYYYSNGVYKSQGEKIVNCGIVHFLRMTGKMNLWKSSLGMEATKLLLVNAKELWDTPPVNRINVLNGIISWDVDPDRAKLVEHTHEFLSTIQIPVTFDPEATCPVWHKFLSEVLPNDVFYSSIIWQIIGWLIIPHTSFQLALILTGSGANGKSTFLRGLRSLIGHENYSAVDLHQLEKDRFMKAQLVGKLANICPDISGNMLSTTSVFKSIVGNDAIMAEHKHESPFMFTPFARLVFSANKFPQTPDSSEGFYRRFLAIGFHNDFSNVNKEVGMYYDKMLSDPGELSGLLNMALKGIGDIAMFGQIMLSQSMKDEKREIREATDPFMQWITEELEEVEGFFIPKAKLYSAYNQFTKREYKFSSIKAFGKSLRKVLLKVEEEQRRVDGKGGVQCWVGLRFREGSLFEDENRQDNPQEKYNEN